MKAKIIAPTIMLAYCVSAMFCAMVAIQPILAAICFVACVSLQFVLSPDRKTLKRFAGQLLVVAFIALLNCLLVRRGSIVFFEWGIIELHLESLVYGLSIAAILVSAIGYFSILSEEVSSDEILSLTGGRLPTLSLVASMSINLIPKFKRQFQELRDIQAACTCANSRAFDSRQTELSQNGSSQISFDSQNSDEPKLKQANAKQLKRAHARVSDDLTHLMAMSLEDSLIKADSMRARGWGSSKKRTVYRKIKIGKKDKAITVLVVVLGAVCMLSGILSSSSFEFYPVISFGASGTSDVASSFSSIWNSSSLLQLALFLSPYVLYAVFFFLPHFTLIWRRRKWKR